MSKQEIIELKKSALCKYFSNLNKNQREAVFTTEGPVLILAGAGSGKTTTIINRIINMIYFGDAYNKMTPEIFPEDEEYLKKYISGNAECDSLRLRDILAVSPVRPWNILAITFTNKAAGEMKARLASSLSEEESLQVSASTFHSLCVKILRRSINKLGYDSNFTIYDSDDSLRLIKDCIAACDVSEKQFPPRSVSSVISSAKDSMKTPDDLYNESKNDYRKNMISKIYRAYQERLLNANALDFDDLIYLTVRLFENYPEELSYYQNRFRYILVDEYQDTNYAQLCLVRLLADKYKNLCVVGDDDQSIYSFRGAVIQNILNFEKHFSGSCVIKLEQNYRSTKTILNAANSVISNNSERRTKKLWADSEEGEKIIWYKASDEVNEATFISDTILKNVKNNMKFSDHAILYRMNAQSNMIERAFIKNNIPYRVYGGLRFYDRKEVKDIIAYMSIVNNPNDMLRFKRIVNEPKRGIGESTVSLLEDISNDLHISPISVMKNAEEYSILTKKVPVLKKFASMIETLRELSETCSLDTFLDELLIRTNYAEYLKNIGEEGQNRLENIKELKTSIISYMKETENPTLDGFLEEISLYTDVDRYDKDQKDVVVMMTVHSSKGLEFPNVFLIGMEENIFPTARSLNSLNIDDLEEERRLAYVAITRAKKQLYISTADKRMLFGMLSHNNKSRFISEIDFSLINKINNKSSLLQTENANKRKVGVVHSISLQKQLATQKPVKKAVQVLKSFNVGDRVKHNMFGEGMVISITQMANDSLLEIGFDKVGTKKIMANFAKIQKVD